MLGNKLSFVRYWAYRCKRSWRESSHGGQGGKGGHGVFLGTGGAGCLLYNALRPYVPTSPRLPYRPLWNIHKNVRPLPSNNPGGGAGAKI
jgi:hypothetical protein